MVRRTDKEPEIVKLLQQNLTYEDISKKMGVSISTISRVSQRMKADKIQLAKCTKEFSESTGKIITDSADIKTVEDALEYAEVDTTIWKVDKAKIDTGTWGVTLKIKNNDGTDKPVQKTNKKYHIEVWLKRNENLPQDLAIKEVARRLKTYKPPVRKIVKSRKRSGLLYEVSLFDVHFGMLAWEMETTRNQDIKLAEKWYTEGIEKLFSRITYTPDKIVLPFGNDFFHTNNPYNFTPKSHNSLDVDGRLAKIFEAGKMAVINGIELCMQVAPVEVLWVPGNHDPETSWYLSELLDAWYRNTKRVTVDCDPHYRKSFRWGDCFVGYTHGSEEPVKELPRIFMDEFTEDWASTKHREIHTGHRHRKKKTNFVTIDSVGSTIVRELPSLCETDAWHYKRGYVGKYRAANGLLWHKKDGLIGIYPAIPQ